MTCCDWCIIKMMLVVNISESDFALITTNIVNTSAKKL